VTILKDFQEKFLVKVCYKCSRAYDEFKLISRTKAKSEYLVTDGDLDTLKYIERKNPRNDSWGMMKLYFTRQVEQLSSKKFKSKEVLNAEREKRQIDALNKQVQQSQKKRKQQRKEEEVEWKAAKMAKTLMEQSQHEHEYDEQAKQYREEDNMWTNKCTKCDFVQEWEEF
jgi:DNA repair protein